MQLTTSLLALAGLATALPQAGQGRVVQYVSKFDEIQAGLVPGVPVRTITPLGAYNNLFFDFLGIIDSGNPVGAGVRAQSAPNVLAYDVVAQGQGQQAIRADYDGSKTDHFNLKSTYLGCVTSAQETLTSPAVSCTINVTGFRNNKQVAKQTISFQPDTLLLGVNNMKKVSFNRGFRNVDEVQFETQGLLAQLATAVFFDNLAYDVTLKK
ncbi:hypothetical protein MBLNU230_g2160t1 [Neophaeotheca triangularis]